MKCTICGEDKELRLGFCFDCAEAQSIIGEGVDMDDKGLGGGKLKAQEATGRLKMLIKKGWHSTPTN